MQEYSKSLVQEWLDSLPRLKAESRYDFQTRKRVGLIPLIATFDIETTSTEIGGQKFAFMYEWSMCLADMECKKTLSFYERDWQGFLAVLSILRKKFFLGTSKQLIVWVHNLPFEFQFFRKHFHQPLVFATDDRKPIAVNCAGIVFRDTLILSGLSLAKLAGNLTKHNIQKLIGDLDYSLIRHSKTPLTEQELAYCENDVLILAYYISEQAEMYQGMAKIPLTNTGRVRNYVRGECFTSKGKTSSGKRSRYLKLMQELTLTLDEYRALNLAFQGGFTHANAMHVGKVLERVSSYDFTSSYPAVMLSERFPMGKGKEVTISSMQDLREQLAKRGKLSVFVLCFYNLKSSFPYEQYLSVSRAIEEKGTIEANGRVFSSKLYACALTDVDLNIVNQCYTYEGLKVLKCYEYYAGYLPRAIIQAILKLYHDKTTLKGVKGKEREYLISKGMLNSVYGMCVTAICRNDYIYADNEWGVKAGDFEEQIAAYNASKKRFLSYPWGVYVTAYARSNLWQGILRMGEDYIYSDTDSIKILNGEKHTGFIADYNERITAKINATCNHFNINPELSRPMGKQIGVWDYEGIYDRFKTLGAKRYLVEKDGELAITVAGLPKKAGKAYLEKQADSFKAFNDELTLAPSETGKLTHTYIDNQITFPVTDYLGNTEQVTCLSATHLESAGFTLSMSRKFKEFLSQFSKGYLLVKGSL